VNKKTDIDSDQAICAQSSLNEEFKLSDLYYTDLWVRRFVIDILEMFGCPVAPEELSSEKDKMLYYWALMSVGKAMKKHASIWKKMKKKGWNPGLSAENFCRWFFDQEKRMVIEDAYTIPQLESIASGTLVDTGIY
jgi:hypothetical protein